MFEYEDAKLSVQSSSRDPANVNALKQTCVIVILAFYRVPIENGKQNSMIFPSYFHDPIPIFHNYFKYQLSAIPSLLRPPILKKHKIITLCAL